MKYFTYPLLLLMLSPLASLQAEEATNTVQTSSLEIVTDRTQSERIEFLLEVAQSYANEKDYQAAIDAYERILELDPINAQARYILAHMYINAKQYALAEELLTDMIRERPEDFSLLNNLAWLYATAEDPKFRNGKKAVALAQEAMVLAPEDYHIWSTLSEAYYSAGDYEKSYRAITHMANLAARSATDMTKEAADEYNEQIRKCKRAMDTAKAIQGDEEE